MGGKDWGPNKTCKNCGRNMVKYYALDGRMVYWQCDHCTHEWFVRNFKRAAELIDSEESGVA